MSLKLVIEFQPKSKTEQAFRNFYQQLTNKEWVFVINSIPNKILILAPKPEKLAFIGIILPRTGSQSTSNQPLSVPTPSTNPNISLRTMTLTQK